MECNLSKDLQNKLIRLLKEDCFNRNLIDKISDKTDTHFIDQAISVIKQSLDISFDVFNNYGVSESYLIDEENEIKNLYNIYKNRKFNDDNYIELIEFLYTLKEAFNKLHLIRDLTNAKEDIIKDLKYFKSEEEINNFKKNYENALKNKNIDLMKKYLNSIQSEILNEWSNLYSNVDNMNEDNFIFIGHSTLSTKFEKGFSSKFVSSSLFTPEFNDTYRSRYGFILKPKNIVGANSKDMNVNNYAYDEESMLFYSSIPIIHHPKRVLDELREDKKENEKDNPLREVYSEIIIDGFDPIGIFCFTNGTKEYDHNYSEALKLKENFPDLKFKVFDTMKKKIGPRLINEKLYILRGLNIDVNKSFRNLNEDDLYRYEMFFNELDKLKNTDYTKDDIKKIFIKNNEFVSIFVDENELFSGKYTDEEIKYVLGRGYKYNIDEILKNKKVTPYNLKNLNGLCKYKDLNKYYEGLDEFLLIINKVDITDDLIEKIIKEENLSFYKITKILASNYIKDVDNTLERLNKEIESLEQQYNSLLVEKKKEKIFKENENIYFNSWALSSIESDLDRVNNNIKKTDGEERGLLFNKNELLKRKDLLLKRIEFLNNSEFNENEFNKKEEELNNEKKELSKHPFLNRKKIKDNQKESKIINIKKNNEKSKFDKNKQDEVSKLDFEITVLDSSIQDTINELELINEDKKINSEELNNIKNKLIEYYNCDNIEEVKIKIEEAYKYINDPNNQVDCLIDYHLEDVKQKLNKLYDYVEELEKDKQSLL